MNPRPFWLRFEFMFVGLTTLYWLVVGTYNCGIDFCPWNPLSTWWRALIGMFVPVGPNNFILFIFSPFAWGAGIVIVLVLWYGETMLERFNRSALLKICANLILLFLLTMAVDIMTLLRPQSVLLFYSAVVSQTIDALRDPRDKIPLQDWRVESCSNNIHTRSTEQQLWSTKLAEQRPDLENTVHSYCTLNNGMAMVAYDIRMRQTPQEYGTTLALIDRQGEIRAEISSSFISTKNYVSSLTFNELRDGKVYFTVKGSDETIAREEKYYWNLDALGSGPPLRRAAD